MTLALGSILIGIIGVIWGADRFVTGGVATADRLGVSRFVIGLTIIAIGTSAPEIWVAVRASMKAQPELAIGNAIGSNIANIGLVLGISVMIREVTLTREMLRIEMPFLLCVTVVGLIAIANLHVGRGDAVMLLGLFALSIIYLVRHKDILPPSVETAISEEIGQMSSMPLGKSIGWTLLGLIVLQLACDLLIYGATELAGILGVRTFVIGLTIVAIGTSLPELAVTVGAALKNHAEVAIGNVIGSNVLNLLLVLAIPGLLAPAELNQLDLFRDGGMLMILTLSMFLFASASTTHTIGRVSGLLLFATWLGYMGLLVLHKPLSPG